MAEPWKTEFHVIVDGEAVEWLEDKAAAIAVAEAQGGKVEAVTSYLDDRKVIWPEENDA